MRFIEVRGAGFDNKGGELMLAAVVSHFERFHSDVGLVIAPWTGPYRKRAKYGLFQTFDARQAGRMGVVVEKLFHKGYQSRYGMVSTDQIEAAIDISGFAIGDQWPIEWLKQHADDFERRKKLGQRVILLPQALGPFRSEDHSLQARRALNATDLIYARDVASRDHARELIGDDSRIKLANDFTNLVNPTSSFDVQLEDPAVALVPNAWVLKHGDAELDEAYFALFGDCTRHLRAKGLKPFILVHESKFDQGIVNRLATAFDLKVVDEPDPLVVKHVAGRCQLMIGSRFHGLINALSQGVPALGTSWSHKYQALFEDYERPDWLIDPVGPREEVLELLDNVISSAEAEKKHLMSRSMQLKQGSRAMWQEVEKVLQLDSAT